MLVACEGRGEEQAVTATIAVGEGAAARRIRVEHQPGGGPCLVWLGGFRSDMRGSKAEAVAAFAAARAQACLRFDYSGHGESDGCFEDGTISRWLEESLAVIRRYAGASPLLIGSSMGGWLATCAALALRGAGDQAAPSALVLIAPAHDFTERLFLPRLDPHSRESLARTGRTLVAAEHGGESYPIRQALFDDGRRHLLLDAPFAVGCPVSILQGMRDDAVPWEHALEIVDRLQDQSVTLSLIKDGDHRLSREQDIARLLRTLDALSAEALP
jgi:pimeloyl-ACP methyl ester carboxylesterase